MGSQPSYAKVLALAEALPPEQLSRLICELIRLLHTRHGKWMDGKDVAEVRDYLECIRFRDAYHPDGRRKSPEEFLLELRSDDRRSLIFTGEVSLLLDPQVFFI